MFAFGVSIVSCLENCMLVASSLLALRCCSLDTWSIGQFDVCSLRYFCVLWCSFCFDYYADRFNTCFDPVSHSLHWSAASRWLELDARSGGCSTVRFETEFTVKAECSWPLLVLDGTGGFSWFLVKEGGDRSRKAPSTQWPIIMRSKFWPAISIAKKSLNGVLLCPFHFPVDLVKKRLKENSRL